QALTDRGPTSLVRASRARSAQSTSGTSLSRLAQTRTIRQAHALSRQASAQTLWSPVSVIGREGPLDVGAGRVEAAAPLRAWTTVAQSGTTASPPDDSGHGYDGSLEYQGGYVQHNPTFYAIFWLPSGKHYEPGIIDGDLGYAGLMDRFLTDAGSTGEA